MDEYLTPVNDGQVSDESSQTTAATTETVNADNAEATNGGQEQTTDGSKQDTPAQAQQTQEPSTQSKEENAQFAKVRREAEARIKAEYEQAQIKRDAEYAQMAAENGWVDQNGSPITTEAQFRKALSAQRKIDELVAQGKDPEAARAIIERDTLKAEREAEKQAQAEQSRLNAEFQDFFAYFREMNGRDCDLSEGSKDLPREVVETARDSKIPLKYVYADYFAKAAKEKEKNLALGKQTAEANSKNATTSTGSVTGSAQSDVVTEAEISAHADDIAWMNKHFKQVEDYYRKKGR